MNDLERWRWLQEGYLVSSDEADGVRCTLVIEARPDGTFIVVKEEFERVL